MHPGGVAGRPDARTLCKVAPHFSSDSKDGDKFQQQQRPRRQRLYAAPRPPVLAYTPSVCVLLLCRTSSTTTPTMASRLVHRLTLDQLTSTAPSLPQFLSRVRRAPAAPAARPRDAPAAAAAAAAAVAAPSPYPKPPRRPRSSLVGPTSLPTAADRAAVAAAFDALGLAPPDFGGGVGRRRRRGGGTGGGGGSGGGGGGGGVGDGSSSGGGSGGGGQSGGALARAAAAADGGSPGRAAPATLPAGRPGHNPPPWYWSAEEEAALRAAVGAVPRGAPLPRGTWAGLAERLGRSEASVRSRGWRLRRAWQAGGRGGWGGVGDSEGGDGG